MTLPPWSGEIQDSSHLIRWTWDSLVTEGDSRLPVRTVGGWFFRLGQKRQCNLELAPWNSCTGALHYLISPGLSYKALPALSPCFKEAQTRSQRKVTGDNQASTGRSRLPLFQLSPASDCSCRREAELKPSGQDLPECQSHRKCEI